MNNVLFSWLKLRSKQQSFQDFVLQLSQYTIYLFIMLMRTYQENKQDIFDSLKTFVPNKDCSLNV